MISLETRRFLRKKKFWIALIGVLLTAVIIFVNLDNGESKEYWKADREAESIADNFANYEIDDEDYQDYLMTMSVKAKQSLQKGDWKSINNYMRNLNLMEADRIALYSQDDNPDLYYHDYLKHKDTIDAMIEKYHVMKLEEDMLPQPNYWGGIELNQQAPMYPYYQFKARYYDQLAKQDIDMMTYSTIDSSTVFVQFMRFMFPLIPIIVAGLLCYDALQEDKDSGVVKVLLTQPLPRKIYIRKKMMQNIKSVLLIFLIPMLIVSIGFGIFDHYKTARAPVLANTKGITSVELMENTLPEIVKKDGVVNTIGITEYFSIPYQYGTPNVEFELIELWQFTLLCLGMAILVLIFMVLLCTLISVILHNKFAALAVSFIVLMVGMFISSPSNVAPIYAFLPFTYMNPVDIVSGFSTYTYLSGILVLLISNLLLYGSILILYKRKDIIC